jgi:hypothetical protein
MNVDDQSRIRGATTDLTTATRELIHAALLLAAYGEGTATLGTGQRSTMKNLAENVSQKADAARAANRASECLT